jgi:hypothetical protein
MPLSDLAPRHAPRDGGSRVSGAPLLTCNAVDDRADADRGCALINFDGNREKAAAALGVGSFLLLFLILLLGIPARPGAWEPVGETVMQCTERLWDKCHPVILSDSEESNSVRIAPVRDPSRSLPLR